MKKSNSVPGILGRPQQRAGVRRLLFALAAIACLSGATVSQAQISQYLPFDMPTVSDLRASPKKVFSHYFTPYPVSIDNKTPTNDYYTVNYLNPGGEGGIHAGYGGFLRQRPLPRAVRPESNWQSLDAQAEVRLAIDIGLDGFTADLLAGQIDRVQRLMDAANAVDPGFKIVLMPDMESITTSNTLVSIVQTLAAYPAAYRLADGRLVVAPFNAQNQTAAWWQGWLSSMSARGINIAFVPLFQGWRSYAAAYKSISYGYSDWGDRNAANNTGSSWVNAAADAHTYVGVWMHPVAPQDARPRAKRYWEAANGSLFRNTWELGAINKADWVQLITWNDYSEEAEIVPSTGTQHFFYDLSAYYVYWFKKGTPPPIVRDCIYYSHRQHSTTAQPDLTKQTAGAFVLASGSPSNHIEATVFLTANATLEIEIGGVPTQYAVTAPRSVVKVPLQQGQPIFRLIRGGQTVASVQSRFPINNTITYQDLQYKGGSSLRPPVTEVAGAYWPRNPTFPPGVPTGLTAAAGTLQVALSWTATSGATSYNVKRATTSGGPYTQIASPTSASYTDTAVNSGTTYYYVVSGKNAGGESANSAQASATPTGSSELIVTGISWSPANPLHGDAVTFSATIKNQGTVATPAGVIHGVGFLLDGTQVNWSDTSMTSLAAGASRTVTASGGPNSISTWSATVGTHSIVAYVDDVNRIIESNENNNTLTNSITVGAGQPDLIVTAISWSPASPVNGDPVTFSATIKNQGAGATPPNIIHGVSFWVDGAQTSWSDTSSNSLAPGATRTLTANSGPGGSSVWTATAGSHSVRAFVDDVNRMAESNETNNNLTNTINVATLPPPWQTADIGAVGAIGNASYSGGTFTVTGSGADIWGTADEFRFLYQLASGDCTIVARVTAVGNTDPWAKAGVMVRESLAANSTHAFCLVSAGSGVSFQRRTATAGTSASTTTAGIAAPYWVRVVRSGSTFTASVSPDGVTWTTQGSASITMATSVYIGLAVSSHLDGTLCTATFNNVTATP